MLIAIPVWFSLIFFNYQPIQQKGPTCLLAAALMSISVREKQIPDQQSIVRLLPIYSTGIQPYDLMVAFENMGWTSLSFISPPEGVARLIEAGFGAVALVNQSDGLKHAVTITGIQRKQKQLTHLQIVDPNQPIPQWITSQDFEKIHPLQHFLVFFKANEKPLLSKAKFPTHIAELSDQQFRKRAFILKANAQEELIQKKSLLQQALRFDPQDQALINQIKEIEALVLNPIPPN